MVKKIIRRLEVLEWIMKRGIVRPWEFVDHYGLDIDYAWVILSRLKKARLVINRTRGCWELTEEGFRKLKYYGKR